MTGGRLAQSKFESGTVHLTYEWHSLGDPICTINACEL